MGEGRERKPQGRRPYLLVEQHPGAHDELEDVLQGLHGLVQLLVYSRLLRVVHVVPQDLGQLPTRDGNTG